MKVKDIQDFMEGRLLVASASNPTLLVTKETIEKAIKSITCNELIFERYLKIIAFLRENGLVIDNKKLIRLFSAIQLSAYLNNRKVINYSDFFILMFLDKENKETRDILKKVLQKEFYYLGIPLDNIFDSAIFKTANVFSNVRNNLSKFLNNESVHIDEVIYKNILKEIEKSKMALSYCIKDFKSLKSLEFNIVKIKKQLSKNILFNDSTSEYFESNFEIDSEKKSISKCSKEIRKVLNVVRTLNNWKRENSNFEVFLKSVSLEKYILNILKILEENNLQAS